MKRILVYDDDRKTVKLWMQKLKKVRALERNFTVDSIETEQFLLAVHNLEKRRANARRRRGGDMGFGDNPLDNVDVLIVDYDLLSPSLRSLDDQPSLTGERVAYLARCYSSCKFIIALNQYGKNTFDLTLCGHPKSFADLNLGSEQIDNPGLWSGAWNGYRPWYWPIVPEALDRFDRRVKAIKNNLDSPVFDILGIDFQAASSLAPSSIEFLSRGRRPEEVTFRDFVTKSGNSLREKDRPKDDLLITHIAAARISKWVERLVLPGQDMLVDLPHLVSRYPSLLKGDNKNIGVWNKTASLTNVSSAVVDTNKLKKFRFLKEEWVSRPVWYWQRISKSDEIEEVRRPWSSHDKPNYVFCEDMSRFMDKNSAREFRADVSSPFVRRYVVKQGAKSAKSLRRVEYRPIVRFIG